MVMTTDVVLVMMFIMPSGDMIHITKPITMHGKLNMTACMYYAQDRLKFYESILEIEVINIGCPYQVYPIE